MALVVGLAGILLPAAGCTSTSQSNTTPVGVTEGPKDTGSYPNLNVPPPVAAKQLTKEETAANLAQLKAEEQAQAAKGGKVAAPSNATALNTLAKTHGSDTLKQIEGKCDPTLDPNCN
ncbi:MULTISPECIES: hypothetical protein [unclassified Mesorhizobium]|uniref:hypothetical protein n=1 Tax=unclassified Mesorhizobium TaxID=325217 RepID=UPI001FEE1BE1|nr:MULTISPECIES: hypothetical protein [unclassified Mesorhizobium]